MEDGDIQHLTRSELILWDVRTSHKRVPSYQDTIRDVNYRQKIYDRRRHRAFDERRGWLVTFNQCRGVTSQRNELGLERPFVDREAPTTRADEIWRAFIPVDADYRFSRFRITIISNHTLRAAIRPTWDSQYALDKDLTKAWRSLEDPLMTVIKRLDTELHFPQPVTPPQLPSTHGYQKSFANFDDAFEAARRARNAFKDLGAYLAFLSSFWSQSNRLRPLQLLARWLSMAERLSFSFVADLLTLPPVVPNASSHVNYLGMEMSTMSLWVPYLPMFVDFGIPVVACVGNGPELTPALLNSDLTGPFLKNSIDGTSCSCSECLQQTERSATSRCQDPASFFKDRENLWMEVRAMNGIPKTKSIEVKRYGEKTEVHVDKLRYDDLMWLGYACYEWIGEPGSYKRMSVASCNYGFLFRTYDTQSRHWSAIHGEVDFCRIPATRETVVESAESQQGGNARTRAADTIQRLPGAIQAAPLAPTSSSGSQPSSSVAAYVYNSDDEDEYDSEHDAHPPSNEPEPPTPAANPLPKWKVVLRSRLGFDSDNVLSPPRLSGENDRHFPDNDKGIEHALRTLGSSVASSKPSMSRADFVACLCACRALTIPSASLSSIPEQFDIASRGVLDGLSRFQIEKVVHRYREVRKESGKEIKRDVVETRYAIGVHDGKEMKSQYFVVVVDAPTLLEIARGRWDGVLHITRNLAERGIPFATAKYYGASTTLVAPPVMKEGVGIIKADEAYEPADYLDYEAKRAKFLTGARAAVALKEGGFVARLARDLVKDIRTVSQPPTDLRWVDEGKLKGRGRILGKVRSGEVVISDALDSQEIDFILGRYLRIKDASKQDGATLWPSLSAWNKMWLNTGAWNDEAEAWFQSQLVGWRTPAANRNEKQKKTCALRTSKEWTNSGRGVKAVRVVWQTYCQLAERYVENHFN